VAQRSTFLHVLNRSHELEDGAVVLGEVLLNGEDMLAKDRDPRGVRRLIGMVFPRPNLLPDQSIGYNVLAGRRAAGLDLDNGHALLELALGKVGLWDDLRDSLDAPVAGLDPGMQQCLCIARALAVGSSVLLMDEPCSTLDVAMSVMVERVISSIVRDITVVIATHDVEQARRVSDRCAFFTLDTSGIARMVEDGPTADVLNHPEDARTASFVGAALELNDVDA
jgi:phosphate transport system ATP-binding protein